MRTKPLFDVPPPADLTMSKALEKFKAWRGSYAAYRPVKRVQCDECVNVLHEAKGVGAPPLSAAISRTSGGGTLRLCRGHAALWRAIDGIGEKRSRQ